ncbi:TA system VapC family ribonuclease toxin [Mesorhizobium australicum]|uniref:Ribonuclease VapC n=1 Tax=Mesorhizobium australicum TaxID=536018 RepID=A0A1X7PI03_9HYPH|nr:TA system VapC family ribonuclease toxin [Mesorhizobium australicum]SMH50225.1 toxin-antitoxin system PIN domain toxin [Mesorhizobium australicum]
MAYLLDVSVVIALIDRTHIGHDAANLWFADARPRGWATCPIVENGVVRIMSQSSYPNAQASPAVVAAALQQLCRLPAHEFWPDGLSLTSSTLFDLQALSSAHHVTDMYLLGLAAAHDGKLATFDRRLRTEAVQNGPQHIEIIA